MIHHTCTRCGAIDCRRHTIPQRSGSTRQWRVLRARVLALAGHTCQQCGNLAAHADHITARSAGGTDTMHNLQALCGPCNLRKGDARGGREGEAPRTAHPADTRPSSARAGWPRSGAGPQ